MGQTQVLWWTTPAPKWDHAVPVGNGRIGAMVFGGVETERLQLNEQTIWAGGPRETDRPEALEHLAEVRKLLFEGKVKEADAIAQKNMVGPGPQAYQMLGDLKLKLHQKGAAAENYRRELDLDSAVCRVSYRLGGVTFTREIFVSAPDQVMVMRLTADKPGSVDVAATLDRGQDLTIQKNDGDRLILEGQVDGGKGLHFRAVAKIIADGAAVAEGKVEHANSVTILLGAATNYFGDDALESRIDKQLAAAVAKGYEKLLAEHVADYRKFFRRVAIDLGSDAEAEKLSTDQRVARVQKGEADPGLVAQYFQFARYLLISSSRPGGLPANLQGIWAEGFNPPWQSDFHININLQMNYWPAEVANLPEMHEPVFALLDRLRVPGRRTAKIQYGAGGWMAHHATDAWLLTTPVTSTAWGLWPTGGAWMCRDYWEHYRFTGDEKFLRERAYPVMKEASEFFIDYLVDDGHGHLVSGPSMSPENSYRLPDGTVGHLCMGPTMDEQIIRDLWTNTIAAADVLKTDEPFRDKLEAMKAKLLPTRIGKRGGIMEWPVDWDENEPGHRHMSHLFGLHPGSEITPRGTPDLAAAARKTLELRLSQGGGHTGWSRAWIINFYARLGDGEQAYQHLTALLAKSTNPNLFDMHPPFQIDGNFGGAAGIAEMLLQSHTDEIVLLPALSKAWPTGSVKGLRARGGYTVDIAWADGKVTTAAITADRAGKCRVRSGDKVKEMEFEAGETQELTRDEN